MIKDQRSKINQSLKFLSAWVQISTVHTYGAFNTHTVDYLSDALEITLFANDSTLCGTVTHPIDRQTAAASLSLSLLSWNRLDAGLIHGTCPSILKNLTVSSSLRTVKHIHPSICMVSHWKRLNLLNFSASIEYSFLRWPGTSASPSLLDLWNPKLSTFLASPVMK